MKEKILEILQRNLIYKLEDCPALICLVVASRVV